MTNLINKFKRDIAGILWLALAVFLGMALASFNPVDPSFNSVSLGGAHKVFNLCGYFGSFLSDLLYQTLGIASWLLVLGSARMSFFAFKGKSSSAAGVQRIIWGALLLLILSSLFSL